MVRSTSLLTGFALLFGAALLLSACSDDPAITEPEVDTGGLGPLPYHVVEPGDNGCTLGFWKNNPELWEGYSPDQTLESVFDVPDSFGLDNYTLLQALNFGGGPGVVGAARLLLKQAVAALLNASHPDVQYPDTETQVINLTNSRLATGNRNSILALKDEFDRLNNLGCPLSAHGELEVL